ncbi:sulfatase-like hydrolase/transferase [Halorubrum sp. CBA1125]|uniref:sulfatase n=1 Tax=Halorubrum sp. CBA1125 TaxID=2668072 RepID=UPI0012E80585|nr:sulfatase [Halorubrum sp. CBA1125]MUW13427.1 sulfatase-like hydrolase/transferase [Halorubrum sp. CBA1125]
MKDSNVLLVTIDSLRYDKLINIDVPATPCINSLSTSGCEFTQAVSNGPNTTASFPAILTGTHSLSYGPYGVLDKDKSPFLARSLSRENYDTIGYHSNPFLGNEQNYHTGFEVFNDLVDGSDSVTTAKDRIERQLDPDSLFYHLLRRIWHLFSVTTDTKSYARGDSITGGAIDWMEARRSDDPFFMWLHYMDVHYPFDPPKWVFDELPFDRPSNRRIVTLNGMMQERPEELDEQDVRDLKRLYFAEARFVDRQIGRMIDAIADMGELEDTIIAVTADHGEAFGEHDRFGHHVYPYDELIRVPLVIGGGPIDSQTVDEQVQLLDLAPTLLDLVSIDVPKEMEGRSIAPLLRGEDSFELSHPAMFISESGKTFGVRTEQWKFIRRSTTNEKLLFDLESDPNEEVNVASANGDVIENLENIILEYEESVDAGVADIEWSDETKERLQNLGYLQE